MNIEESFTKAIDVFKTNPVPFVVGFAIVTVAPLIVGCVPYIGWLLSPLLSIFVSPLVYGGLMLASGKSFSGVTATNDDLFAPFRDRPIDYFVVGIAILAGTIACGVGVVVTSFLFMFAPILVAEGAGYEAALRRSYELVIANLGECLIVFVLLSVAVVAGCLAALIGVLVTGPVAVLMLAQLYIELKNKAYAATAQPPMY